MQDKNAFVANLHSNVDRFRSNMSSLGFNVMGDKNHPICPVFLGDAALSSKFADEMLNEGIYVIGFSYPVVPKGKARIRVQVINKIIILTQNSLQISAAHSNEQIDKCIGAFKKIGQKLGVIH
jgi:glycine C-acetyltransferase